MSFGILYRHYALVGVAPAKVQLSPFALQRYKNIFTKKPLNWGFFIE
jgi:hypothetical protein